MQKFFPYHIVDDAVLTANSGTFQKVLPSKGLMTQLDIEFRAQNGTTSNKLSPIPYCISRIEIVGDGVDKILSLNGAALFKYLACIQGRYPEGIYDEYLSIAQAVRYCIPFGRYFGDREYGLRLDKYSEVRVDITYDLAAVNAVGVTGYTSGTGRVDIVGHITPPGASTVSRGCRRVIERKSWTSASSGDESWDLVADYPYTALGVYARESAVLPSANITNFKLDLGGGKPKLADYEWVEFENMMKIWYPGEYISRQRAFATDAETIDCKCGNIASFTLALEQAITVGTTDTPHYYAASIAGDIITLEGFLIEGTATYTANVADTTLRRITMVAQGNHVGNLLMLPLADPKTWDDALLPGEVGDAVLSLTQGNADAVCYVISEQILPQ